MQQVAKRVTSVREIRVRRVLRAARRDQRGASLLEAIAYLGIAAIVVIGAVALLNGAFSSAGTNELAEQVNAIQSGVKKLYMGQTDGYTGVSNSTLAAAGVFPSTVPASGTTATNNWGGAVAVTGGTGTASGTFMISYANVPKAVCINAVSAGGSWTGISVGGGTPLTVPVSPADAQTACATDSNTIVWTSN